MQLADILALSNEVVLPSFDCVETFDFVAFDCVETFDFAAFDCVEFEHDLVAECVPYAEAAESAESAECGEWAGAATCELGDRMMVTNLKELDEPCTEERHLVEDRKELNS